MIKNKLETHVTCPVCIGHREVLKDLICPYCEGRGDVPDWKNKNFYLANIRMVRPFWFFPKKRFYETWSEEGCFINSYEYEVEKIHWYFYILVISFTAYLILKYFGFL